MLISLADMCPKRPLNKIEAIYGDGIFDDSFKDGIDLRAVILGDVYHLFLSKTSIWKTEFGPLFGRIEGQLKKMIYSYTEQEYNDAFNDAKTKLSRNVAAFEALLHIDTYKHMFAKYLVQLVPGNLGRQGSSHAEQNHSSYVARIGPKSVADITVGIMDMLERQRQFENENNFAHSQHLVTVRGKIFAMQKSTSHENQMSQNYVYNIQFVALQKLSPWGYDLCVLASNMSLFYTSTPVEVGHQIQRNGSNAPPRLIKFGERCICSEQLSSHGFQCRHEMSRDQSFRIELYNTFWLQLTKAGHSVPSRPTTSASDNNHTTTTETDASEPIAQKTNDELMNRCNKILYMKTPRLMHNFLQHLQNRRVLVHTK